MVSGFMDNVKNDRYYLDKILGDLKFVIDHTKDKTEDDLVRDEVLLDSIMFRIIQVSEASGKLSQDFKLRFDKVPWIALKGMRNKIVHDYGAVNITIVYDTVKNGIPFMYDLLLSLQS